MKKPIVKLPLYIWTLACISGLVAFLTLTQPSENSVSLSFIPLLLLGASIYSVVLSFFKYALRVGTSRVPRVSSASLAAIGVLLVMFSAVGQLEVFNIVLLLSLISLSVFYFSRTWPK